jgi:hypothetical protein
MDDRKVINATVEAIRRGYDGFTFREPGDVFLFSGVLGSWMRPVKDEADAIKADDILDELRLEASSIGVSVDQRWGEKRLRSEIDKALAK